MGPGDHVVEVGAGLGSLTVALAGAGADVVAVELDRSLVPPLQEQALRDERFVNGAGPGFAGVFYRARLADVQGNQARGLILQRPSPSIG